MRVLSLNWCIYQGNCLVDYYFFCAKKNYLLLVFLPYYLFYFLLHRLRIIDTIYIKKIGLKFLRLYRVDPNLFWHENIHKIAPWFSHNHLKNDIIISSCPGFILEPLEELLNIQKTIGTDIDYESGLLVGNICLGEEKIIKFNRIFPTNTITTLYTGDKNDMVLVQKSLKHYYVTYVNGEALIIQNGLQ